MVYLPTVIFVVNVANYTNRMDAMGNQQSKQNMLHEAFSEADKPWKQIGCTVHY